MSDQRPVSYSELDTFRQCPMKWDLAYRQGWKPDREKEAFRLGHIWHEIMERHYLTIKGYQDENHGGLNRSPRRGSVGETDLLETCAGEVGAVLDKLDDATRELMVWAYLGYLDAYGCDPQWRIIATEQRGEVALAPGGRKLVYIIDLVVEDFDYGGTWIVDHKFPGDLASDLEIDLDDQLGLYWFAWVIDGSDLSRRVNGAMLNESRKKRNVGDLPDEQRGRTSTGKLKGTPQTLEQRYRRTRTSRTTEELAAIAADALKVVQAMQMLTDAGALYSSPNPKQCQWKCDFREVHILQRAGGLPFAEILGDFGFTSRAQREERGE